MRGGVAITMSCVQHDAHQCQMEHSVSIQKDHTTTLGVDGLPEKSVRAYDVHHRDKTADHASCDCSTVWRGAARRPESAR